MSEDEQSFLKFVEAVCQRPAMHLGRQRDFDAITAFLEAYSAGFAQGSKTDFYPFGRLLTVLEHSHGFSNSAWGWRRHYLHEKGSEEKAIEEFPQFLREALEIPESQILEWHRTRIQGEPPPSPHTAHFDQ
jgi:hypothetical protein